MARYLSFFMNRWIKACYLFTFNLVRERIQTFEKKNCQISYIRSPISLFYNTSCFNQIFPGKAWNSYIWPTSKVYYFIYVFTVAGMGWHPSSLYSDTDDSAMMFYDSEKHNVRDRVKKILSARLMRQSFLLLVNLCIHYFSFISLISFASSKNEKYTCMSTCRLETYPFFSTWFLQVNATSLLSRLRLMSDVQLFTESFYAVRTSIMRATWDADIQQVAWYQNLLFGLFKRVTTHSIKSVPLDIVKCLRYWHEDY